MPVTLRLIVFLLFQPGFLSALRCYYCDHPSRSVTPDIWIHKTAICSKRRIVQCSPTAVACVVVRVAHPRIGFGASGCSEDIVTGCDVHELPGTNTTVQRCQCHGDLCNVDLHLLALASYTKPVNVSNNQLDSVPSMTPYTTVNRAKAQSKSYTDNNGQRLQHKNHHHQTRRPITATISTNMISTGSTTSRLKFAFFLGSLCVTYFQKLFA